MRATSALPRAALNPSAAAFRPLAALQSLLAADHVALQQRLHAAQQLERYFARLEPTRALVRSYEPYLPLLLELLGTGGTPNGRELQTRVLAMLLALSRHDPCGVGDWMATNTSVGNPQWLVQWSYELVRQTGDDSTCARDSSVAAAIGVPVRPEASTGRGQELDRLCARVLHMWRTLLDHTDDAALVALLVQCLLALLTTEETAAATDGDWQLFVLKKLQTHFVDIADVLIGWMMSVGPQRQLREEILSLLHSFGRLWADNSVFSLQLLTSFADEIANLCESWNDYQEDDSDRLSTLLVSFVMVAQCVPNLALAAAAAGADSCFERVMRCVALCPQPKYSLFCLANCSVYLVAMSDCKHSNFSTLSVTVVRFLLYQCAVQSQMHDSEVDKLLWVVENTCKLASANFCNIQNPLLLQPTAIGALRDEMPAKSVKKSGKHKHETTMECLFYLNAASGATYITHLCLQLVQLGGIGALKVLGAQALQNLSGRQYQDRPSYFVFAATCFILVSREPKNVIHSRSNDDADITAILEALLTMLEKYGNRQYQPRLVSRQLCLVLEMASTFICAVSSWNAGRSDAAEIHKEITHRMLECAASLLSSRAIVVRDCRLNTDLLKLIDAIVSETVLAPVVSQQVYRKLVKTTQIRLLGSRGGVTPYLLL
ncbi:unnamed protein product [Hyaloperonospora brassicae]|uniref:Uncharacterized protein n=1 Tax=Hyaloperonospora brassicae TaxID=162125 RepID=A0AAV0TP76_HYABA|nr:unnamed protein product [Hyaloperonospora brassicae]